MPSRQRLRPAWRHRWLELLVKESPLSAEHTQLLLHWMTVTPTGAHRIRGLLPHGVAVFVCDSPENESEREAVIAMVYASLAAKAASIKTASVPRLLELQAPAHRKVASRFVPS